MQRDEVFPGEDKNEARRDQVVSKPAIRAIVWDLGNVLIRWDPRNLYRKLFAADEPGKAAMEEFLREVCSPQWNEQRDAGASFSKGIRELSAKYPQHDQLVAAYFDRWAEMLGGAIESNVALMRKFKAQGLPTYALTNWSAETFPTARKIYPFLGEFDGILMSGEERMVKPDQRFYQLLVSRYALNPQATLFIDDSAPNIAAARAMGFTAVHYTPELDLAAELAPLGLL